MYEKTAEIQEALLSGVKISGWVAEFKPGLDLGMIWEYHYKEIIDDAGFSDLRLILPVLGCADPQGGIASWLTTWIRPV